MKKRFSKTVSLILVLCAMSFIFPVFAGSEDVLITKKMTIGNDKIYVLQQETSQIEVFDFNAHKIQTISIEKPDKFRHRIPSDLAFYKQQFYLSYYLESEITVHDIQGKLLQTFELQMKHHEGATSLLFNETNLFVGTSGYVMVFDEALQLLNLIPLPVGISGLSGLVTDLAYCSDTLFVLDSTHQEIHVFRVGDMENTFSYYDTLGGYGIEAGRFMNLKGISAHGKIYTAEYFRDSFQEINLLSRDYVLHKIGQGVPFASDILIVQNRIFLCSAASEKLYSFPLYSKQNYPDALVSGKFIDFGTVPLTPSDIHYFSILSSSGFPVEGSIEVDHPVFKVHPSSFTGIQTQVSVMLDPAELKTGSDYKGKLTVKFTNNKEHTISLKAHVGQEKDFQIILPACPLLSSDSDPLLIRIDPQNNLEDDFVVVLTTAQLPFKLVKKDALLWQIEPIGDPPPAFYPLNFQVRSSAIRTVKQDEMTLLYRKSKGSLPGSVLGEYFAADWCRFCPSGHKALLELRDRYSTNELNFVTYYNDCLEDTPVRLCFPGAESRMRWYVPTGTHVSMFFNGDYPIHGGINAPDATMTDTYQERIQTLLVQPRLISLTGTVKIHSSFNDDDTLHIGASIIKTTDIKHHDLRLIALIAENNITWSVATGQTEHNFVARKFLDYVNPEIDPAYGKKILDNDNKRFDVQLFTKLDPLIKRENAYVILMVQDRQTREIYQSHYLSLEPFKEVNQISIRGEKEVFHLNKKEDNLLTFYIQNQGNVIEQGMFKLDSTLAFPEKASIIIGTNTYDADSQLMFDLNPMETLSFKLFLPAGQDYPKKSFLKIKVYSNQIYNLETYLYSSNNSLPRYQVLFPPLSPNNASESFQSFLSSIPFWIKTEPETVILGMEEKKANAEGNLFFYKNLFPGLNSIRLTLIYPDQSLEIINVPVFRNLQLLLTIGSREALFNGKSFPMDAPPYISQGRTMVPLRFISEAFNAHISYDSRTKSISIGFKEKTVSLQINNKRALINNESVELDVPPEIKSGRTFVPLRFIAELFDTQVEWDNATRQIRISTNGD